MKTDFYVQADPKHSNNPDKPEYIVREYLHAYGNGQVLRGGQVKPAIDTVVQVDDGIRAQHPREYGRFLALFNEQEKELLEKAKANPGVPVYPSPLLKAEIAEIKAAEAKKAKEEKNRKEKEAENAAKDDAASGAVLPAVEV